MKNILNKALVALVTLTAASQLQAWTYEFTNHTPHVVAVGMRYRGINEPLEVRTIQPQEMQRFRPGDPGISEWKRGFVVEKFYYIKNPTVKITDANKQNVPWREFQVTFIPSESYKHAIELAEAVGKTSEELGKTGAKAAAAYMTGGGSLAAEGISKAIAGKSSSASSDAKAAEKAAEDAAKEATAKATKLAAAKEAAQNARAEADAAKKSADKAQQTLAADLTNQAKQAEDKAARAKAASAAAKAQELTAQANAAQTAKIAADEKALNANKLALSKAKGDVAEVIGQGNYGLSGLLQSIGKVAARSMAASRHMDIVEDEEGKITFISLL